MESINVQAQENHPQGNNQLGNNNLENSMQETTKPNKEQNPLKKDIRYILFFSLFLGLLFNLLFYGKTLGLSYPLYVLVLYAVLILILRSHNLLRLSWLWLPAIPVIALSFTYFFFSNPIFQVLNFVMIPVLFIGHTLMLTSRSRSQWVDGLFFIDILYSLFIRPFAYCMKPFSLIFDSLKSKANPGKYRFVTQVIIGLLIAIPLLFVIVSLLASADDIFRLFIEQIPNVFMGINLTSFLGRTVVVLVVACLIFSYLWSVFISKSPETNNLNVNTQAQIKGHDTTRPLGAPATAITILVLMDALYAFFISIQFSYLFGSLSYALPQGFTYAQYARKGFFELVVVTVINLVLVLAAIYFVKPTDTRILTTVKVLNTLLVVCTFMILLSAHFRMTLYENVYGFTYLRILTHAFMAYLFVLYSVTLCRIWLKRQRLLKSFILISLAAYMVINFMNIDRIIVNNNIERYNNGCIIDIVYLTNLSYDAVVPLVDFMNSTSDQKLAGELKTALDNKRQWLDRDTSWQSYNISENRARQSLSR